VDRTLTKFDIVRTLAQKHELEIASTRRVVQGTLDMIIAALLQGDKIELRNFGVFEVIIRAGRIARNPRSREEVFIPERKVVKFKPGKVMEDRITVPSMKGGIQPAKREPKNEPPRISGEGTPR
jgi:DNA-binding protein HU-beta/integration host factor subunit beta